MRRHELPPAGDPKRSLTHLVVIAAGSGWEDVKGTDRQLAEALSARGEVLWVDPAVSFKSALHPRSRRNVRRTQLVRVAPRLTRLTVIVPPGVTRPVVRGIATRLVGRAVRKALPNSEAMDIAVVSMGLVDCFDWVPGCTKVLYLTDDLLAGSEYLGMSRRHLEESERRAMRQADLVFCVSQVIAERMANQGRSAQVLPNGCDVEHFESPLPGGVVLDLPPSPI